MLRFAQNDKLIKKEIAIAGIKILLTQKRIRNLHLKISAPDGEVRVSAPLRYGFTQIQEFILQKVEWIKKSQIQIRKLRDEGKIILPKKFISGEEHYFFGKKFRLELMQNSAFNRVMLSLSKHNGHESPFDKLRVTTGEENVIELQVKKLSNFAQRQKLMDDFYRKNLKEVIPPMIAKYEKKMSVKVAEFRVKKNENALGNL